MGGVRMEQVNSPWGFLPRGWRLSTIDEEKEKLTDYVANGSFASLASNVHYKDTEDYAVLIRLVDFNNDFKGPFVYIDEHAYNFLSKSSLSGGEIIISNVGANVGTVFKCPNLPSKMSLAPNAITIKLKGDNDFYYYWFKSKIGQANIKALVTGSAQPKFNKTNFRSMYIPVPPLSDQRRIASILSSLDRKIELNNKINADLEEMAQAIFKNWFVDFEPFKDGKFVESELGIIPEGWKVGCLGELCKFKRGKNLLTKNAIDEGIPVVAGGLEPSCFHNVANTGAPVVTVSGSGANAGFMKMYHVPVWASDCSFIDISCENFYFVYCFLKVNSKLLKHAQTGAVQPHVKPSDIHDFELIIPDKKSIIEFQDKVKPFYDRIAATQKESSRLSALRDTLLPRLMSGEISIPD